MSDLLNQYGQYYAHTAVSLCGGIINTGCAIPLVEPRPYIMFSVNNNDLICLDLRFYISQFTFPSVPAHTIDFLRILSFPFCLIIMRVWCNVITLKGGTLALQASIIASTQPLFYTRRGGPTLSITRNLPYKCTFPLTWALVGSEQSGRILSPVQALWVISPPLAGCSLLAWYNYYYSHIDMRPGQDKQSVSLCSVNTENMTLNNLVKESQSWWAPPLLLVAWLCSTLHFNSQYSAYTFKTTCL